MHDVFQGPPRFSWAKIYIYIYIYICGVGKLPGLARPWAASSGVFPTVIQLNGVASRSLARPLPTMKGLPTMAPMATRARRGCLRGKVVGSSRGEARAKSTVLFLLFLGFRLGKPFLFLLFFFFLLCLLQAMICPVARLWNKGSSGTSRLLNVAYFIERGIQLASYPPQITPALPNMSPVSEL